MFLEQLTKALTESGNRRSSLSSIKWSGSNREHLIIFSVLLVLCIGLSMASPAFLTQSNLLDITRVVSINGIMALGMTFVILTGGIDLSVGSTFALAGVITAGLVTGSYSDSTLVGLVTLPVPFALFVGILVGVAIGFVNGLIITRFKVGAFVVTLGMMIFARGLTYLYSGGYPVNFKPMSASFGWIGQGSVLGLPTPTVLFIVIIALCWWIIRYTAFGRSVYAIGGNEEAARLSGINVKRIQIFAYSFLGALAAFSGIIMTSRVASGSPVAGTGYELDVIAAVVIGGTSLVGGKGSIFGTILGVFIIGVIENGLNLMGVSTYYQYIIKGLVLITAVGIDGYLRKKKY
ncbi:ribose ABC transporter permease [Bacillus canaveralius]|uniref:Ribose ABC transporter permease n=1 Tax=Bacillus canaveralius TaxID=1403243 RepID=A0A2N5GSI5_9BACI|nr:ribose ABC transporter permease [Bacillus canaveralius]PLR92814.1 ribose ABC transporter permease [Bacillus canaveralius]